MNKMLISLGMIPVIFIACQGQNNMNNSGPDSFEHTDISGDCLSTTDVLSDSGYMELNVINNDLYINHRQAYYSCCLDDHVTYEIAGLNITATEHDLAERCRCDCWFNLQSILHNFDWGIYTVALIGISGDTVGVDTVQIGPIL